MADCSKEDQECIERMYSEFEHDHIISLDDSEDFFAIVVGQTYIEAITGQLFERRFKYPPVGFVPFGQMVSFVIAFGDIPETFRAALSTLATIRNDFAHKLGHKLPDEQTHYDNCVREIVKLDKSVRPFGPTVSVLQACIDVFTPRASAVDGVKIRAALLFMYALMLWEYKRLCGSTASPPVF